MRARRTAVDVMRKPLMLLSSIPVSDDTCAFIDDTSSSVCGKLADNDNDTSEDIVSDAVGPDVGAGVILVDGRIVGLNVGLMEGWCVVHTPGRSKTVRTTSVKFLTPTSFIQSHLSWQ